ncbi:MAG: hypothetical protein AB1656_13325 [Candidatus Omnitrophota bacterium]
MFDYKSAIFSKINGAGFILLWLFVFSWLPLFCHSSEGRFLKLFWFESGIEHGNPSYNSRFRVNAPESVLHPAFKDRGEVRGNGMMLILMEEDLSQLAGAELYLEVWGGHPGTANKRVSINGRSVYGLADAGTEDRHCSYSYPLIPLKITDLCNGYNAFQFACDAGSSFWGHFIVDNACLRAELKPQHPFLAKEGLVDFQAAVHILPSISNEEMIPIQLSFPQSFLSQIERVDFEGYYIGYDENGDGKTKDWHGFTKDKRPAAIIGSAHSAPFAAKWNASMLPTQKGMAVRAIVHFKNHRDLVYITPPLDGITSPIRTGCDVDIYYSHDLPKPFWSRANKSASCSIDVDADRSRVERAELHVAIWDGGRGETKNPFTLNGHPLEAVGEGKHDVIYRVLPIDPAIVKNGPNRIELLSSTEHHGIEVLLPGPALIVRHRKP